jgi:ATP-dependent Clp protease ATP-binding subunit ClpB
MRIDRLTSKLQVALSDAQSVALGRDHNFIEPAHLLTALLDQKGSAIAPLLQNAGVNVAHLKAGLASYLEGLPRIQNHDGEVNMSNDLGRVMNYADKLAQKRQDDYIASELVILAMAQDRSRIATLLREAGATAERLEQAIDQVRGGETVNSQEAEDSRQALKKYTVDLTEQAEAG